jgi:hypothetical protein
MICKTLNDGQNYFTGSRVRNPDCYLLDSEKMNGKESHTIHMEEGTVMNVDALVSKGSIGVTIGIENENPIYISDSIETGDFQITAETAGDYIISVDAKHFAGELNFKVE